MTPRRRGTFPFGSPLLPARPSADGPSELFTLGAYPSAIHIRWVPPAPLRPIRAMPIDNEPSPFWDGEDAAKRVREWLRRRRWDPAFGVATPADENGSSGRRLQDEVLTPLGYRLDDAWLTDSLDTYHGSVSVRRRIEDTYDPARTELGLSLPEVDLPTHPSTSAIVRGADVDRIAAELDVARPKTVVTLGQAALEVMRRATGSPGPPNLSRTGPYGEPYELRLGRRKATWYAVVHPGQRDKDYRRLHDDWVAGLRERHP